MRAIFFCSEIFLKRSKDRKDPEKRRDKKLTERLIINSLKCLMMKINPAGKLLAGYLRRYSSLLVKVFKVGSGGAKSWIKAETKSQNHNRNFLGVLMTCC
jgi:hypothetical protein